MKNRRFLKPMTTILCIVALLNLTACGTLLHPERKGQSHGRLDPGVVLLDAIGMLFFFVPGVIAFAVDFSNGTIYLPNGKHAQLSPDQLEALAEDGTVNVEALETVIRETLAPNSSVSLDLNLASRVRSESELDTLFVQARLQLAGL